MTLFDWVVTGLVGASLLLGLWRGVVGEMIALAAWVLGALAAWEWGGELGQAVYAGMIADSGLRSLAGCVTVFLAVLVVMALVRLAARGLIKALGLTLSDRLLGMLFGLARGLTVVLVVVALGGMTSAPRQTWWQEAMFSRPLETAVLMTSVWLPDDWAKRIRFRQE